MKTKKSVLENHKMPIKERCARIDYYDTIDLEWQLNMEHLEWIQSRLGTAREAENKREKEFRVGLEVLVHDDKNNTGDEYDTRWRWLDYGLCKGIGYEEFTAKHKEEEGPVPFCDCWDCENMRRCDRDNEEAGRTTTQSSSPAEAKDTGKRTSESGVDIGSEEYTTAEETQSSSHCDDSE